MGHGNAKYGINSGVMPDKPVHGSPVSHPVERRIEDNSLEPYEAMADRTEREDANEPRDKAVSAPGLLGAACSEENVNVSDFPTLLAKTVFFLHSTPIGSVSYDTLLSKWNGCLKT